MDTRDLKLLAVEFVLDYLERTPEYIDVVEFAEDAADFDLDDDILAELFQYCVECLGIVSNYVFEELHDVGDE